MNETSESLLTQILEIVASIQTDITQYEKRLGSAETTIIEINNRIDRVLTESFPSGDANAHRVWHENKSLPAWRRKIINMVS